MIIMKKEITKILTKLFILPIFTIIVSCRVTPQDENLESGNISSNEPISVKINFLGVVQDDKIDENPHIAENNSGGGVKV